MNLIKFINQMSKTSLYKSVNPLNNKLFHQAALHTDSEVDKKLQKAYQWYQNNRHSTKEDIEVRFEKLSNVHALLG